MEDMSQDFNFQFFLFPHDTVFSLVRAFLLGSIRLPQKTTDNSRKIGDNGNLDEKRRYLFPNNTNAYHASNYFYDSHGL